MATTKYTRQEFEWIFSLQRVQATMLKGKDSVLSELYGICDNLYQRDLLKDLIIRFNCFDDDIYNLALNEICSYVTTLNYEPNETAVIALCHDSLADSSQVVLNDLKIYIAKLGVNTFINRFDRLKKYYNRGIRHFIAVDEFIGSGQTVYNRFDEFHKLGLQDVTLDFCIIAGMKEAVVQCRSKGVSLYVSYIMKRGLSDYYSRKALSLYVCEMKN